MGRNWGIKTVVTAFGHGVPERKQMLPVTLRDARELPMESHHEQLRGAVWALQHRFRDQGTVAGRLWRAWVRAWGSSGRSPGLSMGVRRGQTRAPPEGMIREAGGEWDGTCPAAQRGGLQGEEARGPRGVHGSGRRFRGEAGTLFSVGQESMATNTCGGSSPRGRTSGVGQSRVAPGT